MVDIEQHKDPIPITIRLPDGTVLHRLVTHTIRDGPGDITFLLAPDAEYDGSVATKGSEFGGVLGKIAPLPHKLRAHEEARLMRQIDPMDSETSVDDQRIKEARSEGRPGIANPDGFTGG